MKCLPNIDTIYILIDIENFENMEILEYLKKEKENALLAATNNANNKHLITINDISFQIFPNGTQGYTYILRNNLYEVKIAQKRSKLENFYPIQIRISSENLWSNGLSNAWSMIYNWVTEAIGNIKKNKVCRIDLCCHVSGIDFIEDYEKVYKGKFKKKELFYTGNFPNAITFGSRKNKNTYCRIYNKTLEITETKSKLWFKDIWQENEMDINSVWNLEFELKSDILREFNLIEVQNVIMHLKDLWQYCTCDYLVKINNDNNRTERCSVNSEWIEIQNAYNNFQSMGLIERKKQIDTDANALIPSIVGYITAYSARKGNTNIEVAFDTIYNDSQKFLKNKNTNFEKEVENKIKLISK